jgi:hypothetical protein
MSSSSAPYIAGAGAVLATWLLERVSESKSPSSTLPAARAPGLDAGLEAAARPVLACSVARLSTVRTIWGAPIRTLPSGAGEDFVREFVIQRSTLTRALGDLAIAGVTNRPKLSPPCAEQWLELWLDAFQVCNHRAPSVFATVGSWGAGWWPLGADAGDPTAVSAIDWRSEVPVGGRSELGRAVDRCRALYSEARALAPLPGINAVLWLRSRQVTEAIHDLAIALDRVGFVHDVAGDALASLRRDLHPVRFLEKAADVVVAPIEVVLDTVAGPTLAAIAGTLIVTLAPWAAIGAAAYFVARRAL